MLGLSALVALGMFSGCGHRTTTGTPVIIYHNGYYGYYSNSLWCDWTNNYCGSGLSYGISNDLFNVCYPNGCGEGSIANYEQGGPLYGGSSYYNGSEWRGGSPSNGSGSGSANGSGKGNGSGYAGSNYTSSGTGGITDGSSFTANGSAGSSGAHAVTGNTKDVDLQRAELQQQSVNDRAQEMVNRFQMSLESARQLTQLADRMQALTTSGRQMADEDRAALADAAFGVAGISGDEVNAAVAKMVKDGDKTSLNSLMERGAVNLGMPSSAALRDQILPSLGIILK